MKNILPVAEKTLFEPTIGMNRPGAKPISDQQFKEPNYSAHPCLIFSCKPAWFSKDTVSNFEKSHFCFPEYLELRNRILDLYLEKKEELPLQTILQINGDKNSLIDIFDFLEDNKLINAQSELSNILLELEKIEEKEIKEEKPVSFFEVTESRRFKSKYIKREVLQGKCNMCENRALYFTSELVFICEECFLNRKYPDGLSSRNFHKITNDLLQAIWTKEEEYFLLRNLQNCGDDWSKINANLNKSVEQCIIHFIKLPIIDNSTVFPEHPFFLVPNPISTYIAFVCSMVYPSISTELAKCAIKNLHRKDLMDILIDVSKKKGSEVLESERRKILKINKVEIESLIRRIMAKVDAINEMKAEIVAVKAELEDERENLLVEFTRSNIS